VANYYILMADVVRSRSYQSEAIQQALKSVVVNCNATLTESFMSPLTITLGDEFQGVSASLNDAIETLLFLEDALLQVQPAFKLRYVLVYGEIETSINSEIAYGMLGPGLTLAREILNTKRRGLQRFQLKLRDDLKERNLSMLFRLLELISSRWKEADYELIRAMISNLDNGIVAKSFGKTFSQIWKRKKTLQIEEYITIKELIKSAACDLGRL
jgi:hypothetical protein